MDRRATSVSPDVAEVEICGHTNRVAAEAGGATDIAPGPTSVVDDVPAALAISTEVPSPTTQGTVKAIDTTTRIATLLIVAA